VPEKITPRAAEPLPLVRIRRAYFDCRFGQLHVRTAFPTTGGFDEQVTLFCLHPASTSGRSFDRLLPEIAGERSVYAPDLPGCGESDAAAGGGSTAAAAAVADLASTLRLRQIDVLGLADGCGVALALAGARPELVRCLVLIGNPAAEAMSHAPERSLVLPRPPDGAPESLARQIVLFLNRHAQARPAAQPAARAPRRRP
jgi:pimeloyl-ACP methyl ester carboxylesterase